MPISYKTTNLKIPQIARWRICGIGDAKIAEMINMTPSGLAQLLGGQEYRDYEAALMNGHLSEMDKALAGKVDELRNGLRVAVPAALRCLVDAVTQRRDMKTAFAAAREILDRDPDRALPSKVAASGEDANAAPSVPIEVLNAAGKVGNDILNQEEAAKKGMVN